MKTCTVKEVLESIVRLRALDPDSAALTAAQKGKFVELLNDAVEHAWTFEMWPETMLVEQRHYRPVWNADDNYALGDVVFFEDSQERQDYYESLQDGNVAHTPDFDADTAYWKKAGTAFVRTIDFDQEGETEIGALDTGCCVFDADPRVYPERAPLGNVVILGEAILVKTDQAPTMPWIRFRPVPPVFSWTEWSGATAYAIGDRCYLASTGESYKALQAGTNKSPYTETEYWEPVMFPVFLKGYVKHAVAAMLMREDEGKYKAEAQADKMLDGLVDKMVEAQVPSQRRARYCPRR